VGITLTLTENVDSDDGNCIPTAIPDEDFEVDAYLGLWYQTYQSRDLGYIDEENTDCITGEYGLVDGQDDAISVRNCAVDERFGPYCLDGYATMSPNSSTTLQVDNGAAEPQPYEAANYIIFGLGSKNEEGLYSWATITNERGIFYILVRDVEDFEENEEEDVVAFAKGCGFEFEGEDSNDLVVEKYGWSDNCTSRDGITSRKIFKK